MNNPESKYLVTVDEIMVKPQNSPYLTGVVFKGESIGNHGIHMFFFPENTSNLRLCVFLHAIQQSSKPSVIPLYWLAHRGSHHA